METNDFINILRHIVNMSDENTSLQSTALKEVKMWREYFLRKEMKPYSEAKKERIKTEFMAATSHHMVRVDPKEYLKLLEEENENK